MQGVWRRRKVKMCLITDCWMFLEHKMQGKQTNKSKILFYGWSKDHTNGLSERICQLYSSNAPDDMLMADHQIMSYWCKNRQIRPEYQGYQIARLVMQHVWTSTRNDSIHLTTYFQPHAIYHNQRNSHPLHSYTGSWRELTRINHICTQYPNHEIEDKKHLTPFAWQIKSIMACFSDLINHVCGLPEDIRISSSLLSLSFFFHCM